MASIRQKGVTVAGGELKVSGNMFIGTFEEKMLSQYGVKVQVASKDDSRLLDNKITLSKSGDS